MNRSPRDGQTIRSDGRKSRQDREPSSRGDPSGGLSGGGVAIARVRVDGKHFALGHDRFHLRGVTYGTFAPRDDGARFPSREVVKRDFAAIAEAGFTTVRTYTAPPDDLIELASDWDLRLLAGVFWPDWRYLVGRSPSRLREVTRAAAAETRAQARRLAGCEQVLALALGNEVPADVLRWYGAKRIARTIADYAWCGPIPASCVDDPTSVRTPTAWRS